MRTATVSAALVLWMIPPASAPEEPPSRAPADVVFVCAHGNVKSLIASEWFNRLAAERGSAAHAVARGLTPENPVPSPIAEHLRRDGFDVSGFAARALTAADLARASRVVLIGVEAPGWVAVSGRTVDVWDGVPPASEGYEASRDAMRARIAVLLKELEAKKPAR